MSMTSHFFILRIMVTPYEYQAIICSEYKLFVICVEIRVSTCLPFKALGNFLLTRRARKIM
jgi:hypothetical protein